MSKAKILEEHFAPPFYQLQNILTGIYKKSAKDKETTFDNLLSILYNPTLLIQALEKIRPNKGSSTPGTDKQNMDAISLEKITKIATNIKAGTFKFSPYRRVFVPKPGKAVKRPLGIPNFTDRIVQEAIRMILEAIYEPLFDSLRHQNFGFRPGKSTKNNIQYLQKNGTACNYALEGDIVGAYNNVNINILMKLLSNRIKDKRFLAIIKQGCYCGFMEFGKYQDTLIGVAQGGIASPLLFNIYMHEFDLYVNYELQEYIDDYNTENDRASSNNKKKQFYRNPAYRKTESLLISIRKKIKKITNDNTIKCINLSADKLKT